MQYSIKSGINNNYIISYCDKLNSEGVIVSLRNIVKTDWKDKRNIIIIADRSNLIISHELETYIDELIKNEILNECIVIDSIDKDTTFENYVSIDQYTSVFREQQPKESINIIYGEDENLVNELSKNLTSNTGGPSLEVDLDAITHNLNFYKSKVNPPNKVMAMVKANAYGHGLVGVAHHLKDEVDYFGVAYVNEGVTLRAENINTPIMVMNPANNDFDLCIAYKLEPEIYSINSLKYLNQLLMNKQVTLGIHIEINTGMNRLGIDQEEIDELIQLLKESEFIQVKGLYSHLACAEDPSEDKFNREQLQKFNVIAARIESELGIHTIKHIRNSAGSLRYPESPTDMIRLGIGLYGVDSNKLFQDKLRNISNLKTTISQVRKVKAGETIGYNRTFKADRALTIATIGIGYADGFKRLFSNGIGKVLINGNVVPVVGRVNMDMTMVEITDIEAEKGDEVIIFDDKLHVTSLAENANTIPYEIFTSIGERVVREYLIVL